MWWQCSNTGSSLLDSLSCTARLAPKESVFHTDLLCPLGQKECNGTFQMAFWWNPMLARPESCFNEWLLPNVGKVTQKPQWLCRSQTKSGMTVADIKLTILPHQNRFFADTQRTGALPIASSSSHIKFSIANGLCPTVTGQLFQGLLGTLQFGGKRNARSHLDSLIQWCNSSAQQWYPLLLNVLL